MLSLLAGLRMSTHPTDTSRRPTRSSFYVRGISLRYASIHRFFTTEASRSLRSGGSISSRLAAPDCQQRATFSLSARLRDQRKDHDRGLRNGEQGTAADDPEGSADANRSTEPFRDPRSAFANYPRSLRDLALRARSPASSSFGEDASESSSNRHDQSSLGQQLGSNSYRRPSKEDLLRYARGFWTRLRIRFKWFTIRGFRRFNADDFSAFFTLGGLGTIVLIVIGTTTAFSVVLWGLDMLNMQRE